MATARKIGAAGPALALCLLGLGAPAGVAAQQRVPSHQTRSATSPSPSRTISVFASGTVRVIGEAQECTVQPCEDPIAPRILPLHRGRLVRVTTNFPAGGIRAEMEGRGGVILHPAVRRSCHRWTFTVPRRTKAGFSHIKLVFTRDGRIDSVWLVPISTKRP